MRIEKREVIFLSQNESTIIEKFQQVMEGIHRGASDPNIEESIDEILGHLNDLWKEMEVDDE